MKHNLDGTVSVACTVCCVTCSLESYREHLIEHRLTLREVVSILRGLLGGK